MAVPAMKSGRDLLCVTTFGRMVACLRVCLSVCLSVCHALILSQTYTCRIMWLYRRPIAQRLMSSPTSQWNPSFARASMETRQKRQKYRFLTNTSYSSLQRKTNRKSLSIGINFDNLEWPWTTITHHLTLHSFSAVRCVQVNWDKSYYQRIKIVPGL